MSVAATPGAAPGASGPGASAPRARPGWWPDAAALGAALVGLAIALLGPRLVPDTDPYGVDPYSLRLGAVSLGLLAAGLGWRRLRPGLPVLWGVAAVVLPFVLWSAAPEMVGRIWQALPGAVHERGGGALDWRVTELVQDGLYVVASGAVCALALGVPGGDPFGGLSPGERRSWLAVARAAARPPGAAALLRLWPVPRRAVGATMLLLAGMAVVFVTVPATWLGRVAVPLAPLRSDLPLLGPAFALQAAAQELAFRGLLLGTLERRAPAALANLGQASLFGLAHIAVRYEGPAVSIVPLTVALGLVLGWVTQRTGSVWPAIVVHAVVEIGQGYLVLPGLYGY